MAPCVQCGHSALPTGRVLGAGADCCFGEGPLEVVGLCLGAVLKHMRFLRSHPAQALALQRRVSSSPSAQRVRHVDWRPFARTRCQLFPLSSPVFSPPLCGVYTVEFLGVVCRNLEKFLYSCPTCAVIFMII